MHERSLHRNDGCPACPRDTIRAMVKYRGIAGVQGCAGRWASRRPSVVARHLKVTEQDSAYEVLTYRSIATMHCMRSLQEHRWFGADRKTVNGRRVIPPSDGFEWWYLHVSARKFFVTLAIHTTALLGGPVSSPFVSVTIARPGKEPIHDRISFDYSEIEWSNGYLVLANRIVEHRDGWELNLHRP